MPSIVLSVFLPLSLLYICIDSDSKAFRVLTPKHQNCYCFPSTHWGPRMCCMHAVPLDTVSLESILFPRALCFCCWWHRDISFLRLPFFHLNLEISQFLKGTKKKNNHKSKMSDMKNEQPWCGDCVYYCTYSLRTSDKGGSCTLQTAIWIPLQGNLRQQQLRSDTAAGRKEAMRLAAVWIFWQNRRKIYLETT